MINKNKVGRLKIRAKLFQIFAAFSIYIYKKSRTRYHTFNYQKPKTIGSEILDLAIIISTFEARLFSYSLPLVKSIRQVVDIPIFIVVNGNFDREIDDKLRKSFFLELLNYENIFLITLSEFYGCSNMWNMGLQASNKKYNLIMNDDVMIDEAVLKNEIKSLLGKVELEDIVTINGSWSHFIISKQCLLTVGLFDERFLGIGEEDGDYQYRFEVLYRKPMPDYPSTAFINLIEESRDSFIAEGIGKYSLFNKVYRDLKYTPDTEGVKGLFDQPVRPQFLLEDRNVIVRWRNEFYSLLTCNNEQILRKNMLNFLANSN